MRPTISWMAGCILIVAGARAQEVPVEVSPPLREYLLAQERRIEALKHRMDELELQMWRSQVELSRRTLRVPPKRPGESAAERELRLLDEDERRAMERAARCLDDYRLQPDRCPLRHEP